MAYIYINIIQNSSDWKKVDFTYRPAKMYFTDTKEEFMKGVVDVNTPDGISYHRVAKRMDWYQALQECGRNKGHLASITDKTTNDNMALIAKRDGFSLWIGLSKQDVHNVL